MVTKRKPAQKNIKLGKLKLKKETVRQLSVQEAKAVRGGQTDTFPTGAVQKTLKPQITK